MNDFPLRAGERMGLDSIPRLSDAHGLQAG
jgi:hypothetical protein